MAAHRVDLGWAVQVGPAAHNRPVTGGDGPGRPDRSETSHSPTDETVVEAASDAAEGVILSRYKQSELRDFDVTVRFEDGVLDVDVYVNPPEGAEIGAEEVAAEAVEAAEAAVDDLFDSQDR